MLNKRTQVLFDKELWDKLIKLAQSQNTSASKLVREAVEKKLAWEQELEQRRKAVESTLKHRPKPFKGKIDYKALINGGRKTY